MQNDLEQGASNNLKALEELTEEETKCIKQSLHELAIILYEIYKSSYLQINE